MDLTNIPMSSIPGLASLRGQDSAAAAGMAFLVGELEKRDPKLREPLTSVTYPRDVVIKTGGGWVENTSAINVNYATSAGADGGIIGGQTNNIPVMQADIGKDIFRVFNWAHILKVPFIDQKKMENIGRSLDDILDKGIRLNHDKTMDQNVYLGFPAFGTYGLVNNPNVTRSSATKTFATATAQEILDMINDIMTKTWTASEYDLTGMANHILLPPAQYTLLVQRTVAVGGASAAVSILEYLLNNNIGKNQGIDLVIAPSRWCIGAGSGSVDRMVAYANEENRVRVSETVPLTRAMTAPSVEHLAYLTAYTAQMGQVEFLYLQPFAYVDGI